MGRPLTEGHDSSSQPITTVNQLAASFGENRAPRACIYVTGGGIEKLEDVAEEPRSIDEIFFSLQK